MVLMVIMVELSAVCAAMSSPEMDGQQAAASHGRFQARDLERKCHAIPTITSPSNAHEMFQPSTSPRFRPYGVQIHPQSSKVAHFQSVGVK
jgi:hypothetical protein